MLENFARLHIHNLQDLLFHLPAGYQDRSRVFAIAQARPGRTLTVSGEIISNDISYGKRRMLLVKIRDDSGILTLRYFHFNASQQQRLAPGKTVQCFGEVRLGQQGLEMAHPETSFNNENQQELSPVLTPIYPCTQGITQYTLRNALEQLVPDSEHIRVALEEHLPEAILQQLDWPPLPQTLALLHKPPISEDATALNEGKHWAQQRLIFEELLAYHLSLRKRRVQAEQHRAPGIAPEHAQLNTLPLYGQLPFSLTTAQQRVCHEVLKDLQKNTPMQRLVQGDVGSGKTIVAALCAQAMVQAGYQVAVMAPTEILAQQHYLNFETWLGQSAALTWLTGKVKGKAREQALADIGSGKARIVIGTQALFQDEVSFDKLGLIIIDEQHRFGVHQRLALRNKGMQLTDTSDTSETSNTYDEANAQYPHQLIMTATPIPRTLAMTVYADLDVSIIDELPPGRSPVDTIVVPDQRRAEVINRVHEACRQGRQAYWVCTLIEESEALQCQAAEDTAELLSQELPDLTVGLIHGRMKATDKDRVMTEFKAGSIQLLVATTVIEVGVDVPNASLMVIENPERLGLSQLHQLRGRVGRGREKSNCVLLYQSPLSQYAKARLQTMRETNDGFKIAQRDMELRGAGELLGTRQAGEMQFRLAKLERDHGLLKDVGKVATQLLQHYPQNTDAIIQRWIGSRTDYTNV